MLDHPVWSVTRMRRARRGVEELPSWQVAPGLGGAHRRAKSVQDRPEDHPPASQVYPTISAQLAGTASVPPATEPDIRADLTARLEEPPGSALFTHPLVSTESTEDLGEDVGPRQLAQFNKGSQFTAEQGRTELWVPEPARQAHHPFHPLGSASDLTAEDQAAEDEGGASSVARQPVLACRPIRLDWRMERSIEELEPIDEAHAAAFAARFAADYLSWDEDYPPRRAEVLREYRGDPRGATLGWSGVGRQRVDVVLPGRTKHLDDGRVLVEVVVRVATSERASPPPAEKASQTVDGPLPEGGRYVGPSSAPDPDSSAWQFASCDWVRLAPPIARAPDRPAGLIVDISPNHRMRSRDAR
jgi:hypothetical protein